MSWSWKTAKISSRQSLIALSLNPRPLNLPWTRVQHDPVSRKADQRALGALELKFAVRHGGQGHRLALLEIEHRPGADRLDHELAVHHADLDLRPGYADRLAHDHELGRLV